MAKSPLAIEDKAKHSTDCDGIYHETESFMKVNVRLLVKAFSNKTSFIPCNRADEILFDAKHPFVAHYILPQSQGNQSPSTVSDESIVFFLESLSDNAGCRDSWNYGGEAIFCVRFEDDIFRAGLHGMMV